MVVLNRRIIQQILPAALAAVPWLLGCSALAAAIAAPAKQEVDWRAREPLGQMRFAQECNEISTLRSRGRTSGEFHVARNT
jgi:hypothetical protein